MITSSRRPILVAAIASLTLVVSMAVPVQAAVLGGVEEESLQREPQTTPADLSDNGLDGLTYGDPTSGLAQIMPPEANSGGGAELSYPLELPKGRGLTPDLNLEYGSGGSSSWVGYGWSFGVGDISVDTTYGSPLFCPRTTAPQCGNYESESYTLDGDPLMPTAVRTDLQKRIPERQDFTHQQETQYDHIIRHGDSPSNYWWEVRDKSGNVSWYGGFPDAGGPFGDPGKRTGVQRDDRTKDSSSILTDGSGTAGNDVRWYLKAQRDVGVNMIRYEYETVQYKGTGSVNQGITWTKLTDANATCSGLCAKHIYLSKIFYTGAAEASGQPEDAKYEVDLIRGATRKDAVLDARGGFLDLDNELLTRIVVRYTDTGQVAVAYDLNTQPGAFGKTMLASVTQVGCPNGTDCKSADTTSGIQRATHTFDYYDDRGAAKDGFTKDVTWTTGQNDLQGLEGRASALGMQTGFNGDGHVYVGFNAVDPSKTGSFGGSISFDAGGTSSQVEMLDINGDSLPDKVFRKDGVIKYRLNTSQPGDDLLKEQTFSDTKDFVKDGAPPDLPKETSFGITGGVEVYFGVIAMFNAGGNWSWSDGYFTDVNADGLPDFARGSDVWFNHLGCPKPPLVGQCEPIFTKNDSSQTRLPLNVRAVNAANDNTLAQTIALIKRLSPPIDTVRRWVAPYDGRVSIDSTATMGSGTTTAATCQTGGVRLAIQHEEQELASCPVSAGESWHFTTSSTPNTLWVRKGDAVYFRVGPDLELASTKMSWDPQISYLAYGTDGNSTQASGAATDVNGLSQRDYDPSGDFTLAGRPGFVGMPEAGTALFSGRLDKTAATSDWIRPTITHTPGGSDQHTDEPVRITPVLADGTTDASRVKTVTQNQQGDWCLSLGQANRGCWSEKATADAFLQVILGDETGLYDITAAVPIAAPVNDADGNPVKQDVLETYLAIDSPIDVRTLSWVTIPKLCYRDGAGPGCKAGGTEINPPVDTDIYPRSSDDSPRVGAGWNDDDRTVTVHTTFDVSADNAAGRVAITVKSASGTEKHLVDVPENPAKPIDESFTIDVKKGTAYWYDVSVRNPALAEHISGVNVELKWKEEQVGHTRDVPEAFNQTGRQGWFGLGWRGWGAVGYRGDGNRRNERLVQSNFNLSDGGKPFKNKDDACKALNGTSCMTTDETKSATFPGSYSGNNSDGGPGFDPQSVESQVSDVYAFAPSRTLPQGATDIVETWAGPKAEMNATSTGLEASRLGGALPQPPAPGSGQITTPTIQGDVSPSLAVTLGVGPLSVSGAFGWSNSSVGYMDMNGDGFPDKVTKSQITYTDPRGGTGCRVSDTSLDECDGGGVEAVDADTTITVGGGLSGSPVAVKGNTQGKTVAGKGGAASKDQYGASIGAGVDVGFSWNSPMGSDPKWNSDNFGKVPGDPVNDAGAVKQRQLADLNGDGLPDQVKVTSDGVFVRFNLGYTFAPDWVLWADGTGFESGESGEGAFSIGLGFAGPGKDFSGGVSRNASVDYPRFTWTDVNGDGTLDALVKTKDPDTGAEVVKVAFGTGAGLTGGTKYGATQQLPFQFLGGIKVGTGDEVSQNTSIGYGGGLDFTLGFGPLCAVACYLIVNPGAHLEGSLTTTDIDLTDVNGDGFADSVRRDDADRTIQVRLNKQGRTGLLKSVHNPLGGSYDIDYDREGNTSAHPTSTWAMSKLTLHDGRPGDGVDDQTSTFSYDNATLTYDFVHRRDLGFAGVVTRELNGDGQTVLRSTRQRFLNDNVLDAGLGTSDEVYDGEPTAANLVQRTTQTWSVRDGETGNAINYDALSTDEKLKAWSTPLLRRIDDEVFTKGNSTSQQRTAVAYDYDSLGNPSTVSDLGDLNTPADDLIATVVYSTCENAASDDLAATTCGKGDASNQPPFWNSQVCPTWTSLPAIITVKSSDGTVLRHRDGSENLCDNSSVTRLRELISGPIIGGTYAETLLQYDDWGSYDRIVYPLGADGHHYAVHYEYDLNAGHANVAQVTDYELTPDEVGRFLDYPVGGAGDFADGGGEAWLSGTLSNLSGNTFTLTLPGDPTATPATPDAAVDVTLSGSAPGWLSNGADATVFGTLSDDHSSMSDAHVYHDFNEPWGKNGGAPLAAGSVGLTSTATFDPLSSQVATRTDANGHTTTYGYDVLRRLSSIDVPGGGRIDYDYNLTNPADPPKTADAYAVAKHSDPAFHSGNTIDTAVFVDGLGRTIQKKHEADLFSGLNLTPDDKLAVTDTVKFDALGRQTFSQQPIADDMSGLTSYRAIKDGEAGTSRSYDYVDRVTSETKPDGRVTRTSFGFANQLGTSLTTAEVTDPMNRKTKTFIDPRGFTRAVDDTAVDVLDPANTKANPVYRPALRTIYGNDPLGNLLDVSSAGRTQVLNTYDLLGRRTSTTTEDGGKTSFGYDAAGNQVTKQSANQRAISTPAQTVQTTYNYSFGNLVHINYPNGTPDVTMRWGGLNGAPAANNGAGRLVDVTDAARHQTLAYDANGNVTAESDQMLDDHWNQGTLTTTWNYDWLGRARTMTYPDGEKVTNDYDRGGNLSKVAGAKPCTDLGTLAAAVTLTQTTITVTERSYVTAPSTPFVIKVDGEKMNVTNRVPTATPGQFTYTVVRGFGGTTIATHSTGASATAVSGSICNYRYVDRLEYDVFGTPRFQQLGNDNTTEYIRNALNQRLEQQLTKSPQQGGRVQQNLKYTYNDADNVKTYVNDLPADTSALMGGKVTQNYKYDGYYRVTHGDGLWQTAPQTDRHYTDDLTYDDATGNVTTKKQKDWTVKAGCTSNCKESIVTPTTYSDNSVTYNGAHQHQVANQGGSVFTYDPSGNVTRILSPDGNLREMTWNDDGRMTTVVDRPNGSGGKPTTYTYDMNGRLAIEDKEQGRSWFVNPYVTVKDGTMWKNIFAGDDRVGVKASQQDTYEQKQYFLQKDLQRSTNIVTDLTGSIFQHQEYFPSGETWVDEKSTVFRTPYQFAGDYFDEDHGMLDLGERWYDPRRERMPSVDAAVSDDPASILGDSTLQAVYSYAGSNPVSYVDPDGRQRLYVSQAVLNNLGNHETIKENFPNYRSQVKTYFDTHEGLGARLSLFVLQNYKGFSKLQSFSSALDTKPVVELEFNFNKWKVKSAKPAKVKFSFGAGPRAKKTFAAGKSGSSNP